MQPREPGHVKSLKVPLKPIDYPPELNSRKWITDKTVVEKIFGPHLTGIRTAISNIERDFIGVFYATEHNFDRGAQAHLGKAVEDCNHNITKVRPYINKLIDCIERVEDKCNVTGKYYKRLQSIKSAANQLDAAMINFNKDFVEKIKMHIRGADVRVKSDGTIDLGDLASASSDTTNDALKQRMHRLSNAGRSTVPETRSTVSKT